MGVNVLEDHAASIFDRYQCFWEICAVRLQATLKNEAATSIKILVPTHIRQGQLVYILLDYHILLDERKDTNFIDWMTANIGFILIKSLFELKLQDIQKCYETNKSYETIISTVHRQWHNVPNNVNSNTWSHKGDWR
jgi:hypothetical protein